MNIVLFTNTFTPHVGGVAHSVQAFREEYLARGHRVLVVAPEFPDMPPDETGVVRVPAIQNFNASDFSVALPSFKALTQRLDSFAPDIVHSQHPFLLGMTALRVARFRSLPLVFTHHTLYEEYTHYVPVDSPVLKRFVVELATRYANLCDRVFAPSDSIRELLVERGVETPVNTVPTGVRLESFTGGNGRKLRERHGIPAEAFVVGHVGRLAAEKNLEFLARSIAEFMKANPSAYCIMVGAGPAENAIRDVFSSFALESRLIMTGVLEGSSLADALDAMNVFAFASKTETQGMVLTEAMAAGVPVVALKAPGAGEVVHDKENGRLVTAEDIRALSRAYAWVASRDSEQMARLIGGARDTADAFSMSRSAETALTHYRSLIQAPAAEHSRTREKGLEQVMTRIKTEWDIIKSMARGSVSDKESDKTEVRK